jgi:hypothetical protein
MRILTVIFSVGLALTLACSTPPKAVEPGAPVELTLSPGTSASASGLTVTFLAVTGDSRCPVDVTCAWAGTASIALRLAASGGTPASITLDLNDPERRKQIYGRYLIELLELTPEPRSDTEIAQPDYSVRLRVSPQ